MKLIKRDETHFTFQIGRRERDLLFALLQRYPVIVTAHFRTRHPPQTEDARKNQELLDEALSEQQRENRRLLEKSLAERERFRESELGLSFRLSHSELEWMLQILNDIRVGSWIQLGEPDPKGGSDLQLTEENLQLAWAMEMAARFQHSLLEAGRAPE